MLVWGNIADDSNNRASSPVFGEEKVTASAVNHGVGQQPRKKGQQAYRDFAPPGEAHPDKQGYRPAQGLFRRDLVKNFGNTLRPGLVHSGAVQQGAWFVPVKGNLIQPGDGQ